MKKLGLLSILTALVLTLGACASTDVIGKTAKTSFSTLVENIGDSIELDSVTGYWALEVADGEKFQWSNDFSKTNPDLIFDLDAKPFLKAGLDISKLPGDQYVLDQASSRLIIMSEVSEKEYKYSEEPTASGSFEQIVDNHRDLVGYHESLGHYGISIKANKFEWAKDLNTNDKDIVFVLNPQPLIDAGLDPSKLSGWVFTKIDDMGKEVEVILKPYNIK